MWKLSDFSNIFNSDGQKLESPIFGLSKDSRLKFCLHFYSKCPVNSYETFVAIGLGIEQFGTHKTVKLEFSIWVEDKNGEIVKRGWFITGIINQNDFRYRLYIRLCS